MKKLLGVSILGLFILSGCNDDEAAKNVDLTAEDAKELVNGSTDNLGVDVVSLVESDGTQAIVDFANLLEGSQVIGGRVSQKEWTKGKLNLIIQYFVNGPAARTSNDEITSLEDIKGVYEWNPEIGDFDKGESEFFIVRFPTEGSETNNAELKISALEFVKIIEDNGEFVNEYYQPSIIVGYVKVDETTVIELDFEVNWTSVGAPEKANVSLFVLPFNFKLVFDDTFVQKSSILGSISINEELIVGVDLNVEFESAAKEKPVFFEGSVNYRDLKIVGDVDVRDIGEDADPNDFINLSLFSGDAKVGDIVFMLEEIEPGIEDYVAYVEYADGSRQNLEEILSPVLADIEEIFAEFKN